MHFCPDMSEQPAREKLDAFAVTKTIETIEKMKINNQQKMQTNYNNQPKTNDNQQQLTIICQQPTPTTTTNNQRTTTTNNNHNPQLATQPTTRNPQPATHNLQPANPQPTTQTHKPQHTTQARGDFCFQAALAWALCSSRKEVLQLQKCEVLHELAKNSKASHECGEMKTPKHAKFMYLDQAIKNRSLWNIESGNDNFDSNAFPKDSHAQAM